MVPATEVNSAIRTTPAHPMSTELAGNGNCAKEAEIRATATSFLVASGM